jgi:DNA-binding NtrC family response regulator
VHADHVVLLVEADPALRRSLEKFLNRAGYSFGSCSTAGEALDLVRKLRPRVVISEYHLPDANGASLLKRCVAADPKIAAILLSEYDFQVVAQDSDPVHVGWFLEKPFDLVDLENALSNACSSKSCRPVRKDVGEPAEISEAGAPPLQDRVLSVLR